jgi:hypothetical protein
MQRSNNLYLPKPKRSKITLHSKLKISSSHSPQSTQPLNPKPFDPFSNMIPKTNKSPLLQAVRVKPHNYILQRVASENKFKKSHILPPLSPNHLQSLLFKPLSPVFPLNPLVESLKFSRKDITFGQPSDSMLASRYQ